MKPATWIEMNGDRPVKKGGPRPRLHLSPSPSKSRKALGTPKYLLSIILFGGKGCGNLLAMEDNLHTGYMLSRTLSTLATNLQKWWLYGCEWIHAVCFGSEFNSKSFLKACNFLCTGQSKVWKVSKMEKIPSIF